MSAQPNGSSSDLEAKIFALGRDVRAIRAQQLEQSGVQPKAQRVAEDKVVWHGHKAYATCPVCGKSVQVNKPLIGNMHLCLTDCEAAGVHLDVRTRRRGPFWNRRTETYCEKCGEVDQR